MTDYKQQLEEFNSLMKQLIHSYKNKEGLLRFNRSSIAASDIAQQYFCEKKVEMHYIHGEVETEEKTFGSEAHEKLLEDTERIGREDLFREIYEDKPTFIHEMLLLARHKDVVLAGRPDLILFIDGRPVVFFEYKFGRSKRPFPSHHVQAGVYGTILNDMGFNTSQLFYALVLARPEAKNDNDFREKVVKAVEKSSVNISQRSHVRFPFLFY